MAGSGVITRSKAYAAVCASSLAMLLAMPAAAQDVPAAQSDENVFHGDYLVVGGGVFLLNSIS